MPQTTRITKPLNTCVTCIYSGCSLEYDAGRILAHTIPRARVFVVHPKYLESNVKLSLERSLISSGLSPEFYPLESGSGVLNSSLTFKTIENTLTYLESHSFTADDIVLSVGCIQAHDLACMLSQLYKNVLKCVQIPVSFSELVHLIQDSVHVGVHEGLQIRLQEISRYICIDESIIETCDVDVQETLLMILTQSFAYSAELFEIIKTISVETPKCELLPIIIHLCTELLKAKAHVKNQDFIEPIVQTWSGVFEQASSLLIQAEALRFLARLSVACAGLSKEKLIEIDRAIDSFVPIFNNSPLKTNKNLNEVLLETLFAQSRTLKLNLVDKIGHVVSCEVSTELLQAHVKAWQHFRGLI